MFDEEFLVLFGIDQAYRGVDGRDLVLQGIVMTRLERLGQVKHGHDIDDVVGLEEFHIASVADHLVRENP